MRKIRVSQLWAIILFIGAAATALYYYLQGKKKDEKIASLENDKMKLIIDSIQQNKHLSEEIKKQIRKLVEDFKDVDGDVSAELEQALQLFEINQFENAIEDLVKVMEHMLTLHYKEDSGFKKWLKEKKQQFSLHNLLLFCRHQNKITEIELGFFLAVKTIRNKEDHTLNLTLDEYLSASGLITAVGAIFKLGSIVYPPKNEKTTVAYENGKVTNSDISLASLNNPLLSDLKKINAAKQPINSLDSIKKVDSTQ